MNKKTKDILSLVLKLIVIGIILTLVLLNYEKLKNIDVRALVDGISSPALAYLTVIGIYALKGIVFVIPASLVYISVGMAFSPLEAIILNMLGITVEVIISYFFGMFLGGEYVTNLLGKNKGGKKLIELKEKNKQSSIFIVRLLPVFPIDFASLFFGSMKFSFPKYLLFSVLGIAPRVILFTLLGDKAYDLIPMNLIVTAIIIAIPVAAVALVVRWIVAHKNEEKKADK